MFKIGIVRTDKDNFEIGLFAEKMVLIYTFVTYLDSLC